MQAIATKPRISTYGARISRAGEVYAFLRPPFRGRCPERHQLHIGDVLKVDGGWRNDLASNIYPSQTDAAVALIAITCGATGA